MQHLSIYCFCNVVSLLMDPEVLYPDILSLSLSGVPSSSFSLILKNINLLPFLTYSFLIVLLIHKLHSYHQQSSHLPDLISVSL